MSKKKSKDINTQLSVLSNMKDKHLDLFMESCKAYGGKIFLFDLFVQGTADRSMSLINGFCLLIREKNYGCAAGLIRLHLDNILRFYASTLVEDFHDFSEKVMRGEHVRRMKDKRGKLMTDAYLSKQVSKKYPWIRKVYSETSGFIHFSEKHIFSTLLDLKDEGEFNFLISGSDNRISDDDRLEAVAAMIDATKILLNFIQDWIAYKNKLMS